MGLLGTFLALGIGAGSLTAGRLSGQKVELGLVPLGALGMGTSTLLLSVSASSYALRLSCWWCSASPAAGSSSPCKHSCNTKVGCEERGLLLATTNFLSMGAVLVASGVLWVCHDLLKWQADRIILLAGFGLLLGIIYVLRLLPAFVVRLVCWMLTHTLYRIRVVGGGSISRDRGPALLVCNHVSYVDGLLVGACMPPLRPFPYLSPYL